MLVVILQNDEESYKIQREDECLVIHFANGKR